MRHYFLGRYSALVVCARRWRPVRGAWTGAGFCVFPVSPFPPCVSCAVFGGPSRPGVPYPRSLVRHSMRSVRSSGSVRLPFWSSPAALCVCVRSRYPGVSAPSPIPGLVWRAHSGRSRCWALVGPFHAVCAPPRVLPRSHAPFGLLGGGGGGPVSLHVAWGCALPVGWVQAWGPVTKPTASTLACWLCALWGRHEGAWGGRLLPGCGASGVRRCPTPEHSSFQACGRGPLPTGCGSGGCGRGDPSPTPQRPLLRAGVARCGGGTRAPGRGASCLGVERPGSGALPPPTTRPFGRAAGAHYPLAAGAGGGGRGDPSPTPAPALLRAGSARRQGGTRVPGGGAPFAWASEVGRSPAPDHSSFRACGRGPLPTACGCGGCGRGDPSPTPPRALLRAGSARRGGGTRVPGGGPGLPGRPGLHTLQLPTAPPLGCAAGGGGASCLGVGRLGSGALPPPTTSSFGRAAWAHYPLAVGAGGAGVGTRHQPHSAHSCGLALCAVGAACWCPGGHLLPGCRASGIRRSPTPENPSFRACGRGPTTHWLGVRGVRAWGPVTSPTAA